MTLPVDGIKLHRGNFAAIGQQIQPLLDAGQCFRLQVKPWREKRSLSQNALSHMWYTEISEYLIARGKTFATPEWVKDAMIVSHVSKEPGMQKILKELHMDAPLHADMCLGEGTGAVAYLPVLDLAAEVYGRMSTFSENDIEDYKELGEKE